MNLIDVLLIVIIATLFVMSCIKIRRKIICSKNGDVCAGCLIASSCSKKQV